LFDPDKSSTYHELTCSECLRGNCNTGSDNCKIGMSYQEGSSWYANEAEDSCYVGGMHDVVRCCIFYNEMLFIRKK